jgi:hypothetical protein
MRTERLYSEVGKAVELIQLADRTFKSILLLVFPGKEFSDLDLFQKNEKHLDKATLGKLVKTLKSRVSLNDRFEAILDNYLNDRNSLIHNWDEIPNWESEESAIAFTVGVQKQAAYLSYTFLGFMRAWMEKVDFSGSVPFGVGRQPTRWRNYSQKTSCCCAAGVPGPQGGECGAVWAKGG